MTGGRKSGNDKSGSPRERGSFGADLLPDGGSPNQAHLPNCVLPACLLPVKLERLFDAARYKIIYGGRGSGKSWSVARALLMLGALKPLRILCAREFQN